MAIGKGQQVGTNATNAAPNKWPCSPRQKFFALRINSAFLDTLLISRGWCQPQNKCLAFPYSLGTKAWNLVVPSGQPHPSSLLPSSPAPSHFSPTLIPQFHFQLFPSCYQSLFIYLAVPDLSCGTQSLQTSLKSRNLVPWPGSRVHSFMHWTPGKSPSYQFFFL